MWQYGKTEDTAQSQTADGHSQLTNSNPTLTLNGSNFSFNFPSYSMTVIDLAPAMRRFQESSILIHSSLTATFGSRRTGSILDRL